MKTPGVLSSLCSHPAAAPLGCSVFSCKISHGICSSLPQRAGLELDLLLVELPYSLNLGSELGFQAEIGSQMVNPPHNRWERHPDVSPDFQLSLSDGNIAVRLPFLNSTRLMYFCKHEHTTEINHEVYLH